MKPQNKSNLDDFYILCLKELMSRPDWSEAYIPLLERYVTITNKLTKLNTDIIDKDVIVEHTNKAGHTNDATAPDWRMFIMLNREANALAKELKLSPISAPVGMGKTDKKKGFDLGKTMKVA